MAMANYLHSWALFEEQLFNLIKCMHGMNRDLLLGNWILQQMAFTVGRQQRSRAFCFPMHCLESLVLQNEFLMVRVTFSSTTLRNCPPSALIFISLRQKIITCTDGWILSLEIKIKTNTSFVIQTTYITLF